MNTNYAFDLSTPFRKYGHVCVDVARTLVSAASRLISTHGAGSDIRLGRVEDGRENGSESTAPFPIPAHQTGRAYLRHPAFRLASS